MIEIGDSYREAVRKLKAIGFTQTRRCGSHATFTKGSRHVTVVVNHPSKIISRNTVKMMNRQIDGDIIPSWGGGQRER